MVLKLYCFWHSSCSWRVRLALALKGLPYEYMPVDLARGAQLTQEFKKLNPLGYVPVLQTDEDGVICDSIAMLEYLEEKYPHSKPLLPKDIGARATVRQIVQAVASSVQPLQNKAVMKYIEDKYGEDEDDALLWVQKWIRSGFTALEDTLKKTSKKYCVGDELTLADVVLLPQLFVAENRFGVPLSEFPLLAKLSRELYELPEVKNSVPLKQPDAPASEGN